MFFVPPTITDDLVRQHRQNLQASAEQYRTLHCASPRVDLGQVRQPETLATRPRRTIAYLHRFVASVAHESDLT